MERNGSRQYPPTGCGAGTDRPGSPAAAGSVAKGSGVGLAIGLTVAMFVGILVLVAIMTAVIVLTLGDQIANVFSTRSVP